MRTTLLQTLYKYWDEEPTTHSDDFGFWPEWLFQYYNELTLGDAIESDYLMRKSEQHRMTPKYEILSSFLPLVKHDFLTTEEDDN